MPVPRPVLMTLGVLAAVALAVWLVWHLWLTLELFVGQFLLLLFMLALGLDPALMQGRP